MICPSEKNMAQANSMLANAIAVNNTGEVRRARDRSDAATEALIQAAHRSRDSCSETHSRQKAR